MGHAIPGQVGLSYIRKIAEQARRNKPGNTIPPRPLIQFPPPGS